MKLKVVDLQIVNNYEIEINAKSEYVYGVETAGPIFCRTIGSLNIEYVGLLCLDSTNKIINYSNISIGEIDHVKVSIAQLSKIALLSNSSKVIIAHNHPSGMVDVTSYDIEMTKKIGTILKYFDIQLLDSLVVNGNEAVSIRESIEANE